MPSYRHFLKFFLRDEAEPLIVEVPEQEATRFTDALNWLGNEGPPFFCFESVDGRSLAVNMSFVQAAHLLWEPAAAPSDRLWHDGPIVIALRGREEPVETGVSSPAEVLSLFLELEAGLEASPFTSLEDEDGELLILNRSEIVFATVPSHALSEGRRMAEDDLDDLDDQDELDELDGVED